MNQNEDLIFSSENIRSLFFIVFLIIRCRIYTVFSKDNLFIFSAFKAFFSQKATAYVLL